MTSKPPSAPSTLPEEFLTSLLPQLDDNTVTAVILHGSYARGEARPPFSDVDLVRILRETPDRKQQKQFIWHGGYLLNLSSRPLSIYRDWLTIPQEAIFRLSTIRDARILLDKEGSFRAFQQETLHWKWEPLQDAANAYASRLLVELTEVVLRTLGAVQNHNTIMLIERINLHILPAVTEAVGIQRGILATGNNYVFQIFQSLGMDSSWTRYYLDAAGSPSHVSQISLEARGVAALRLYQETVHLLRPCFSPEHFETIETLLKVVDQTLHEEVP